MQLGSWVQSESAAHLGPRTLGMQRPVGDGGGRGGPEPHRGAKSEVAARCHCTSVPAHAESSTWPTGLAPWYPTRGIACGQRGRKGPAVRCGCGCGPCVRVVSRPPSRAHSRP
eukprot:1074544-Prymnesium_polylepis.1